MTYLRLGLRTFRRSCIPLRNSSNFSIPSPDSTRGVRLSSAEKEGKIRSWIIRRSSLLSFALKSFGFYRLLRSSRRYEFRASPSLYRKSALIAFGSQAYPACAQISCICISFDSCISICLFCNDDIGIIVVIYCGNN